MSSVSARARLVCPPCRADPPHTHIAGWTCLRPWTEHGQSTGGFYNCNKFKKGMTVLTGTAGPTAGGDGSSAKAELERYLFYYARYDNHEKAGKFAAKNRIATQNRMAELQTTAGSSWSDVSFLEAAGEALLECRRVLKYTYVWGYYMPDGKERELFEHLQEQMERSTEHLAELTEAPLEKMARTDVANFTRVTLAFMRNLLEGIEEGLTGGEGVDSAGGMSSSAGAATRPVAAAPAPKATAVAKK
jgi:ariadne-1